MPAPLLDKTLGTLSVLNLPQNSLCMFLISFLVQLRYNKLLTDLPPELGDLRLLEELDVGLYLLLSRLLLC